MVSSRYIWDKYNVDWSTSQVDLPQFSVADNARYAWIALSNELYPGITAANTTEIIVASNVSASDGAIVLSEDAQIISGLPAVQNNVLLVLRDMGVVSGTRETARFYIAFPQTAYNLEQRTYPFAIYMTIAGRSSPSDLSSIAVSISSDNDSLQFQLHWRGSGLQQGDDGDFTGVKTVLSSSQVSLISTVSNASPSTYPPQYYAPKSAKMWP